MGSSSGELSDLTNRLVDRAMTYGMEVSAEESKIVTNSTNNISANISMTDQKSSFKYLGATLCKDGTHSAVVHIRIAPAIAAMVRLNRIWWCNTSFASKFKVYKSLVTSILLCCCETWTLLADSGKRNFSTSGTWSKKTNNWVQSKRSFLVDPQEPLLTIVKRWKLMWLRHVTYVMTASPTPSLRASWRVDNAVVGRRNAGWTASKSEHPCPCQKCSF